MESSRDNYNELVSQDKKIMKYIKALEENEEVKQYKKLLKKHEDLLKSIKYAYNGILKEKYINCNHVWAGLDEKTLKKDGNSQNYCICVKCGLDNSVVYKKAKCDSAIVLSDTEKLMYEVLKSGEHKKGIYINVSSNRDLIKAVYDYLKASCPNMSDEELRERFQNEIDNLADIKGEPSKEREAAKRLGINVSLLRK